MQAEIGAVPELDAPRHNTHPTPTLRAWYLTAFKALFETGQTLLELPDADQCCGFGGTFSVKNSDVSVAMATDKARNVMDTGAEYLVTGDNSCLMNIGGLLSREKAGVKPIHLAEILASTEADLIGVGPTTSQAGGVR